jgi:hypothetical protein
VAVGDNSSSNAALGGIGIQKLRFRAFKELLAQIFNEALRGCVYSSFLFGNEEAKSAVLTVG